MLDRFVCISLLVALGSSHVTAAAGSGEACGQLDDATERLVCYDRIFRPSPSPVQTEQVLNTPAVTTEPVTVATQPAPRIQQTRPATEAPVEQIIVSSVPATVDGVPIGEAYFGKYNYEIPKSVRVREVTATVTKQRKIWPDERIEYVLTNGQRWRQTRAQKATIRDGEEVTIRSGRLGGFMLSNARGASARVKRVD